MQLNKKLLKQQKVTPEQEQTLYKLYKDLSVLFQKIKKAKDLSYPKNKQFVDKLEELEYQLQDNWNFPRDANYHSYWYRIPHCICPKSDNRDTWGHHKIINCDCPMHNYLCKNSSN